MRFAKVVCYYSMFENGLNVCPEMINNVVKGVERDLFAVREVR